MRWGVGCWRPEVRLLSLWTLTVRRWKWEVGCWRLEVGVLTKWWPVVNRWRLRRGVGCWRLEVRLLSLWTLKVLGSTESVTPSRAELDYFVCDLMPNLLWKPTCA